MRDEAGALSKYDAFISYNSSDRAAVELLVRKLDQQGIKVFFDQWCLVPGEPWQEHVRKALAHSVCCVVVCGPQGWGPWQREEAEVAVSARVGGRMERVIPLLLPGTDGRALKESSFLARHTRCDFRDGLDEQSPFQKLCAGIRGAPMGPPPPLPSATVSAGGGLTTDYRGLFRSAPSRWQRRSVVDPVRSAIADGAKSVVLHGLPGMGKTTALCHLADEFCAGREVFALPAGGTTAAEPHYVVDAVNDWLRGALGRGLPAEDLCRRPWREALRTLLGQVQDERVLVLLDDLDPRQQSNSVLDTFTDRSNCMVLVTSRAPITTAAGTRSVLVPPLSREESLDFIAHVSVSMNLQVNPEDVAGQLPAGVLSHPLALHTLLAHAKYVPTSLLIRSGLPTEVLSARRLVDEVVAQLSAGDRRALGYASMLNGVPITELVAVGIVPPADFSAALARLVPRCLVHQVTAGVEVPRLVAEALDDVDPSVRTDASHDLADQLRAQVADPQERNAAHLAAVAPPLALAWARVGAWRTLRDTVPTHFLDWLNSRGYWKEYMLLTRLLIASADSLQDRAERIHLRTRLSRKTAQLGDLQAAWRLIHEAEDAVQPEDAAVLHADLAEHRALLAHLQGDDKSTLRELDMCFDLRARAEDSAGLLTAYKLRGNLHLRRGRYEAAAEAYRRGLAIPGAATQTKYRLDIETSLARCEAHTGSAEAALARLEQVVDRMRALRLNTELPRALHTLALVLESEGRPAHALARVRQAAALRARDPVVRTAVERLLWRLENLPQPTWQRNRPDEAQPDSS